MSKPTPTLISSQIDAIVQQIVPALMDALLPKIAAEVQQMIPALVKEKIAQMEEKEKAEGTDREEADDEDVPELINQPRRQRLQNENTTAPPPPAQRTRRPRHPRLPGPTPEQLRQNQEAVFTPIEGTPRNAKVSDIELLRRRRAASMTQRLVETKADNNAGVAVSVTPVEGGFGEEY
jgi:hypothetical protein